MAEELPPHYLLLLLNDARRIRGGRGRLEEALFGALEGGEKTVCRERLRRKKEGRDKDKYKSCTFVILGFTSDLLWSTRGKIITNKIFFESPKHE